MEKRYNRTQFAKKIGVARSTLYYWERKGLLRPRRTMSLMPYYTDEDYEYVTADWNGHFMESPFDEE